MPPDSMFGPPSQHLLPSHPSAGTGGTALASDPHTAPVQPAPVSFKDFRFNSIGKRPELLNRISLPHPDQTDYHSPTPSPTSTPPPASFANDAASQPKPSSRPTLLQQLAGNDFSTSVDVSTSLSNRSLASRIQMKDSSSNDIANTAHNTTSSLPSPPSRVNRVWRVSEDAGLIPPVEVLPQSPESSPPTPTPLVPAPEPVDVHSPTPSTSSIHTTVAGTSQILTPTIAKNTVSRERTGFSPSSAAIDATMQELQPSSSTAATADSLVARQERLQAISASLTNLAPPFPPSSFRSSSSTPSSVSWGHDNIILPHSSQLQRSSTPVVLRYPYSANQLSSEPGLSSTNDTLMSVNDSSLTLVPSLVTIPQELQTRRRSVIEAMQKLGSVLNTVHNAQVDSENALAFEMRALEERRAAFEQTKQAEETRLLKEFQELQQRREELNVKEASLASFKQEIEAREVARKAMLAKWQAQEEEKRAAEAKRSQEVQEQLAAAVTELEELEALRGNGRLGQLASEAVPDDLPTEPQGDMDAEEISAIKSCNDLLRAIKHLRRMHSDKVQKLEESKRTLRKLEEGRKQREAEEAEHRRIVDEQRIQAHAQAERARQSLDAKQRQQEAERKRREVENAREQARLSVEQQARAEAQPHGLRHTEATSDRTFEDLGHHGEASLSQQQGPAPKVNSLPSVCSQVPVTTSVDEDRKPITLHHTFSLSDSHTSPGGAQSVTPQSKQKKDGLISGGVMLAVPASKPNPTHLPPKPLTNPPSLPTSDRMTRNVVSPARTPPTTSVSAEGGHASSFPAQFASEFNRMVNADIHPTPPFPRTPKSRALLDATIGVGEEFNIGPYTRVSPTQQNVNLRHLKRYHSRIEENDSGDRSVRTSVKNEEPSPISLKREEHDEQSRELVQASFSANRPAFLPPRPATIAPPRPRKHHAVPASQTDPSSSHPPESNKMPFTAGEAEATTDEPLRALPFGSPNSRAVNISVQLPVPAETANSFLLGPVHGEPQQTESRINAGEKSTQDRTEHHDTTSSQSAVAAQSHEWDGEERSRDNRRLTEEQRRARDGSSTRRLLDHCPPLPVTSRSTGTSPTQSHRPVDSWRPQTSSNGPRAEPIRAHSPTTGRKRAFAFSDDEHDHRARRQRGDVWIAQDHDRDRVDSYRQHWDRHHDSEADERRATYRVPASPPERTQSYPSDAPRAIYGNRTYIPPLSEESAALPPRWEQSYRRPENDNYQRYQSTPGYNATTDQYHTDDIRVGQTYEPTMVERMDAQSDSSLLARMSNTQRFPPPTTSRGRGRGEPIRGRADFSRGRGRGIARGGLGLLERLTSPVPPSLEHRLT